MKKTKTLTEKEAKDFLDSLKGVKRKPIINVGLLWTWLLMITVTCLLFWAAIQSVRLLASLF